VRNSQDAAPSPCADARSRSSGALAASDPRVKRLTAREHQVARLIAQGLKDALIARRLGISASTVSAYVGHIKHRLRLATRAEIAAWVTAREDGPLGAAEAAGSAPRVGAWGATQAPLGPRHRSPTRTP
jgi:DNA-binding CsgD family transcriptional regulator